MARRTVGRTVTKKVAASSWKALVWFYHQVGDQHRQNAESIREHREAVRRERDAHLSRGATRAQSWFARHPMLADIRDAAAQKGHELLDRRDLRSGLITEDELNLMADYDSQEEWRQEVRRRRRELYREQRARDRDITFGPLTQVVAFNGSAPARVEHVGFRPPAPRKGIAPPPSSAAGWQPPTPRVVRRKRKDRVSQLAAAWGPQIQQNASKAMATDADLSAAKTALLAFVETFPETRTQVHEHGGKMGEFGKGFAEAMERYQEILLQGRGEDNPGMPPEVVKHLKPLSEVGDTIVDSCTKFLAAWEDYFAEAIRAAKDEHTPSKQALTS